MPDIFFIMAGLAGVFLLWCCIRMFALRENELISQHPTCPECGAPAIGVCVKADRRGFEAAYCCEHCSWHTEHYESVDPDQAMADARASFWKEELT